MSGLVVRPGDTLVIPVDGRAMPAQAEAMKRAAAREFPGVTVVVISGMTGGAFVYRPDPSASGETP